MVRRIWILVCIIGIAACFPVLPGCGDGGDSNLPVRRAKMREIKLSTDHMMASLQNRSLEGVEKGAQKIQKALDDVVDLYPPEHKAQYRTYTKDTQIIALSIAAGAKEKNVKAATVRFRKMVPYCGKCHEDCAFALAPAFPEYSEE